MQVCGPALSAQLDLVCLGKFNTRTGKKRSGQLTLDDFNVGSVGMEPQEDTMMFDYIDNALTARLMSGLRHHRLPRGVADECCKRPCTLATMQEYCA